MVPITNSEKIDSPRDPGGYLGKRCSPYHSMYIANYQRYYQCQIAELWRRVEASKNTDDGYMGSNENENENENGDSYIDLNEYLSNAKPKRDMVDMDVHSATNEQLPWFCPSTVEWKDIGPSYFPRQVQEVKCRGQKCWYSHLDCKPVIQKIKVLKESIRGKLRGMGKRWNFEDIPITMACQCTGLN